jgi:hypothetical protein
MKETLGVKDEDEQQQTREKTAYAPVDHFGVFQTDTLSQ